MSNPVDTFMDLESPVQEMSIETAESQLSLADDVTLLEITTTTTSFSID